jgi:hypothetical protein
MCSSTSSSLALVRVRLEHFCAEVHWNSSKHRAGERTGGDSLSVQSPAIGGPDTEAKNSVVSAAEELRDRGVSARQRLFIRQENNTKMLGPGLLPEA